MDGCLRKLVYWELKLEKSQDEGMNQVLAMQKNEANQVFTRFYEQHYIDWINGKNSDKPVPSRIPW